ncbi:MAG: T9SS type A sorting domain-containing protein [Ignavibacteriales bacterium]|nr:T9SS type A sorting domain-containing protein [Ignavibacteriales bacterium]
MLRKFLLILLSSSLFLLSFIIQKKKYKSFFERSEPTGDWFYAQRAFPFNEINYDAYKSALQQANAMKSNTKSNSNDWTFAGPVNIGGRITDVEMPNSNTQIIYSGAASGGVFKSTNLGESWFPIFDSALSLSIGDIAISPTNENTIYVGTGEPNGGSGSVTYGGFGVYKSADAGEHWISLGLDSTRYIGKIALDPTDSQKIFVAAMGNMYANTSQRGVYRTTNGGNSWEKVFFISDSTGCIDVAVNPTSPNIIYAAMWERIRHPGGRTYGGMTSGIYRSTDGGNNWSQLTNGLPANSTENGRITLALSPSNPNIIYASYVSTSGPFLGMYKSTNNGDSWTSINISAISTSGYDWWFGGVRVHPTNPNSIYLLGFTASYSTNSGTTWNDFSNTMHVDHHALFIHPTLDLILEGNDGGLYYSVNEGMSWTHFDNLPITQFYTCEIDEQLPERLYGGTQDNGTNRTLTGNTDDWEEIFGGDGFYVLVDPADNSYIYMEYQYGGFSFGTSGIDFGDRFNWSTPFVFNPQNSASLFLGSNKLYKTTNRAGNWNLISGDLTNGPSPGNLQFGTITTIAVAPSDSNVIYVGTDDANVWVTTNGGTNWNHVSDSLPHRWITRVAVDNLNSNIAYVTISGFRWNEPLSHIFRTTNAGETWNAISSNLPEAPVNDVIVDPELDSTLYAATDVGVFVTNNLGNTWEVLGNNLPNVVVNDLVFHNDTRTLVAATYGRSMYKINVASVTSVKSEELKVKSFSLSQNFPNPFNPTTIIRFTMHESRLTTLKIYDIMGKEITTLLSQNLPAGEHEVEWNASNAPSGIYFSRLQVAEKVVTVKMVLVK